MRPPPGSAGMTRCRTYASTLLAKYREAFTPSRAKDDPTDAEVALELLLRYPDKLPRLQPESADMRRLRRLVELRRALVDDRVAITNRLTSALKGYFPQILGWFRDKDTPVFAHFSSAGPRSTPPSALGRTRSSPSSEVTTSGARPPSLDASRPFSPRSL